MSHIAYLYKEDVMYVILKDFTESLGRLIKFDETGQSSLDSELSGKFYTYEDVLYMINKHTKIKEENKKDVILDFWRMFFLDAILGNRDRHKGNWGYINKSGSYFISPIYDNGNSLFPNVIVRMEEYKLNKSKFIIDRSEKFPASLLGVWDTVEGRVKRTNFYHFISGDNLFKYPEMSLVYNEFMGLGLSKIFNSINSACSHSLILEDLRRFYVEIVCCRYLHIILRVPLSTVDDLIKKGFPWGLQ